MPYNIGNRADFKDIDDLFFSQTTAPYKVVSEKSAGSMQIAKSKRSADLFLYLGIGRMD